MNLELSLDRAVTEAAGETPVADPGAKPDDRAGEQDARHRALAGLGAALTVEAEARAAGAAVAARRAEAAVWLGASLADLGAVTGRSRQAARKRWPHLGAVHRRRRWLGDHVEDVLWAARLVLDASDELEGVEEAARDALADAVARTERAFAAEPADLDTAVGRWQEFDALVDRHLRGLLAGVPDEPAGPRAGDGAPRSSTVDPGFAAHGARSVLLYYDHAVHESEEASSNG